MLTSTNPWLIRSSKTQTKQTLISIIDLYKTHGALHCFCHGKRRMGHGIAPRVFSWQRKQQEMEQVTNIDSGHRKGAPRYFVNIRRCLDPLLLLQLHCTECDYGRGRRGIPSPQESTREMDQVPARAMH